MSDELQQPAAELFHAFRTILHHLSSSIRSMQWSSEFLLDSKYDEQSKRKVLEDLRNTSTVILVIFDSAYEIFLRSEGNIGVEFPRIEKVRFRDFYRRVVEIWRIVPSGSRKPSIRLVTIAPEPVYVVEPPGSSLFLFSIFERFYLTRSSELAIDFKINRDNSVSICITGHDLGFSDDELNMLETIKDLSEISDEIKGRNALLWISKCTFEYRGGIIEVGTGEIQQIRVTFQTSN